ncbi:CheR family methyltransferase [Ancylobacter sp. SL191]|uniref:CheR family methyltransferase n=1 Tax=Ancylobacter sp. SL191 TaxID=2995166 RepID=UPI00226E50D3|nr:protein-glutamate O-methyltransferase CheR [Ancylobacter sp. SL191]WAC28495.1 protein-glutamate O-methyltransferase CheR [Ancylobacter sp. SL191]
MSAAASHRTEHGPIERLLHNTIGLDAGTLGAQTIAYAVRQRLAATGIADETAYARHAAADPTELQELVNAIVVPETWFFRDPRAFAAMTQHVAGRATHTGPLRLLSLPCSTGEEAYSMAMALLDAGIPADGFVIDAVDVSTRNIVEARRAIYGRNSFRGRDLAFRERYFEAVDGGYRPHAAVRAPVRLRTGNLFDPGLLLGETAYDVIFCRNLLIYFDRADQIRALERLGARLAPDGLLLVGPAESGLPLLNGYASLRSPMAFAFTRVAPTPRPAPRPAAPARRPSPRPEGRPVARPAARAPATAPHRLAAPRVPVSPAPAAPSAGGDKAAASLAAIEAAANAGRLAEAKAAAHRHIAAFGPSAGVFYLLGLACDAGDDAAGAAEQYRKALYLAPDHREALAHLALLLRRKGDEAGAARLRARLERLGAGGDG